MTQPPVAEQFCGGCRYWRDSTCRRFAPHPQKASVHCFEIEWPLTSEDDWCGEWVSRDA